MLKLLNLKSKFRLNKNIFKYEGDYVEKYKYYISSNQE